MADAYTLGKDRLVKDILSAMDISDRDAADLAGVLLTRGWTQAEYIVRFPGDYVVGRVVEVLDQTLGLWVAGQVSGSVAGTVQVDTARGPRTAGSARSIRPLFV